MSGNDSKLWLQRNLNANATQRALAEIERTGQAIPCKVIAVDGSIVTVSFEVMGDLWPLSPIALPKAESQWLRAPTQIGDYGITVPADTYLGGISGYGGVADLTVDYGNMSCLVWVPIGSKAFAAGPTSSDGNPMAWINGPDGAALSDTEQTTGVFCDPSSGAVTIKAAESLTINIGGQSWTFTSTGFTMSTGIVLETHLHGGVQVGGGVTTEPEA